ncbi:MAG TPA: 50S ribosomal protein L25, partial [Cyanobacteria bacterium UBA9579]|nr:50S ribosomal protein L25 [Cyanobacteria bacterium UBA9579]
FDSVSLQLDEKAFSMAYKGDKTVILELKGDGDTYNALVKHVQSNAITDEIYNIEFYNVKTGEKLKVSVPVAIVGESPAVKAGGILRTPQSEIEIECLPKDIPSVIEVSISGLENLEDTITVGDIKYPAGITPVSAEGILIVKVSSPTAGAAAATTSTEVAGLAKK